MCGVSPLWFSFSAGLSFILQVVSFGEGPIGVTCHLYRFSAVNLGVVVTVESRKLFSTLDSSHILQFSLTSNKAIIRFLTSVYFPSWQRTQRERCVVKETSSNSNNFRYCMSPSSLVTFPLPSILDYNEHPAVLGVSHTLADLWTFAHSIPFLISSSG